MTFSWETVYKIELLLSVIKPWKVNTYKSQVTVTSLNASEAIVVNSSPNNSLNTIEKRTTQQAALEILNSILSLQIKKLGILQRSVVKCVNWSANSIFTNKK